MSEHLTHIAIYDDTYRLVLHSKDFHEAFKTSLRNHPDVGLLCSASRGQSPFCYSLSGRSQGSMEEPETG